VIGRHQLPTSSPLPVRALFGGFRGALGRDFRERLIALIQAHWSARDVLLVDSGTSALRLAIQTAITERPGPVAVPAYSCYDVATAAMGAGTRVVLYDLDPDTLAPRHDSLAAALEHSPSAVVLIHAYGIPVDVAAVRRMLPRGILVIEDAAQAFGASIHGTPAGSHGDLGILSFGRGKGLTGGAGGAVITKDDREFALLRAQRRAAAEARPGWMEWSRVLMQLLLARPSIYAIPAAIPFLRLGETVLHAPHEPRPITLSAAATVCGVWDASRAAVATRQENARELLSHLKTTRAWRTAPVITEGCAGYLRLPVRHTFRKREEVLTPAARRLGIIEGYPRTLATLPGFRELCINADASLPGAEELARSLVTLPTHGLVSASDRGAMKQWLSAHGNVDARSLSGTHAVA